MWKNVLWVNCALALIAGASAAAENFTYGHVFLADGAWRNGDVIELDRDLNPVRNLGDTLPSGHGMAATHMRFGPDGNLYVLGELDDGNGWRHGVLEFSNSGYEQFYAVDQPPTGGFWGFAVLPNGNWVVSLEDSPTLREYSRDFTESWGFTGMPGVAESLFVQGGKVYGAGNHTVEVYDIATRTYSGILTTSEDNDNLVVSAESIVAVNYQWPQPDSIEYIELVDADDGNLSAVATMPDEDLMPDAGLAFGPDGKLYVAARVDGGNPQLVVYSAFMDYEQTVGVAGWEEAADVAVYIPEPLTLAMLGLGGLALLRRRR
ncbi:MAG: PEP-CTERM sorting domain-containing protein [Phycisphaerae bacterium]